MKFRNEYSFLSNMYPCKVIYKGKDYGSVENLFQAFKCTKEEDMLNFIGVSPKESKYLGRKVNLKKNWNLIKVNRMRVCLYSKFKYNPDLLDKLLNVNCYIEETNDWNDTFWGVCNGFGDNMLGKLLMEIRDYYINK